MKTSDCFSGHGTLGITTDRLGQLHSYTMRGAEFQLEMLPTSTDPCKRDPCSAL